MLYSEQYSVTYPLKVAPVLVLLVMVKLFSELPPTSTVSKFKLSAEIEQNGNTAVPVQITLPHSSLPVSIAHVVYPELEGANRTVIVLD
jgi:hypothetical protein